MFEVAQRVVVIQDASRDPSSIALRWALNGLSLQPGDGIALLGVLHQVNTPSTFPFTGAKRILGYKTKVDSNSMFGLNHRFVVEEVARKKEEYQNSMEISQIRKLYQINKIDFRIEIRAASSPKAVALEAANELGATWVILDRQMKKDKKYFMEKLSCGISRMKRDNSIEQLRGPRTMEINTTLREGSRGHVTYDEMLPGSPEREEETISVSPIKLKEMMMPGSPEEDDLFSLDVSLLSMPQNTYRNSLVASSNSEEHRIDSGKGPPWTSARTPSFSTSTSSEHLTLIHTSSSPIPKYTEAPSTSSFRDARQYYTMTQTESDKAESSIAVSESPKMGQSEILVTVYENQDFPNFGLADMPFVERFDTSECSVCRNGRPRVQRKRDFTYGELEIATRGFSKKNFLSEGGFGSVYKGQLEDGQWIAVKQHKDASLQGEKEFKSEVLALTGARHKNVVMLLGSSLEGNHRLLVYEFVCNGSLEKHLSQSAKPLDWTHRMRIALGVARGLRYLHENNIIHRDMRPNNILVTHDYEPMLGDFGLARTQHNESECPSDTRVVGTFGYLAPEYAESGKVSTKIDVYSFGVVLLELITGQRTIDKTHPKGESSFLAWAKPLLEERKYHDLIDSRIFDLPDIHQLFGMVYLAERCLKKDPTKRPSMKEVVHNLKCIISGESVSEIGHVSPPRSNSFNSIAESIELQGNNENIAQENQSTEISSISCRSQRSEISSSSSAKSSLSMKSSRSISFDNLFASGKKNYKEKKATSRSQMQLLYGEMLL